MPRKKKVLTTSEKMARMRKERKAAGLVEFRLWLTPEERARVKNYIARHVRADAVADMRHKDHG